MGYLSKTFGKIKKYKHKSYVLIEIVGTKSFFYAQVSRTHDNWIKVSNIWPLEEEGTSHANDDFEIIKSIDIEKVKEEHPVMFI